MGLRVLRKPDLQAKTGLKMSTVDLMERDEKFPQRIKLGRGRAVGWIESEIDSWIAARAAERIRGA
jgi:prophage regulatory protein